MTAPGNYRHWGCGDSAGHGGFTFYRLIYRQLLKKHYADKNRHEAIICEGGLDWIVVPPAVLNDKPGRGTPRALEILAGFHGGAIARDDVASFVLTRVNAYSLLRRSPLTTR